MVTPEVTDEQREQVRIAVAAIVEADEVGLFEDDDLDKLWREKFRTASALRKATRETLLGVLARGLVGYLKPDAGGKH